jgi:hypothetical protein
MQRGGPTWASEAAFLAVDGGNADRSLVRRAFVVGRSWCARVRGCTGVRKSGDQRTGELVVSKRRV